MLVDDLKKVIREVPDFPKPGINFYDLTTLFRDPKAFRYALDRIVERFRGEKVDYIAAIEARGFVLGAAMADRLDLGLVMLRKPGKLPSGTISESYALEYGEATLEVHDDAVESGQGVLVIDDVLATGGTAAAAGRLMEKLGARVEGYGFLVELDFLSGRGKLPKDGVFSLIHY